MNRRKTTGIVASAVLAVLGALLLMMFARGKSSSTAAAPAAPVEAMANIWVAKGDLPQGQSIETLRTAQLIEQKSVPVSQIKAVGADAFNVDLLAGKITAVPIFTGEELIEAKFQSVEAAADSAITPGQVSFSFLLPAERMAGVGLTPDETVGVVGSFGANDTFQNVVHIAMHKIRIIGKPTPWGVTPVPVAAGAPATVAPAPSFTGQLFLVAVSLSAPDAERLIFLNQFGTINLIREPLSAKEDGTKLVQYDNVYEPTNGSRSAPIPTTVAPAINAVTTLPAPVAPVATTVVAPRPAVAPGATVAPGAAAAAVAPSTTKPVVAAASTTIKK